METPRWCRGFPPDAVGRYAAAAAGMLLLVSATASAAARPGEPTDAQLRAMVELRLEENRVPAAAVVVRERGGVAWSAGFGTAADGSQVDAATTFGLGSISKGVTGVVLASLAAEGALDLDAPVEHLLPALRQPGTPEAQRRITVRHLVHHTSGLDARGEHLFVDDPPLERARAVWRRRPARRPGEAFEYLNANYLILGLVAQAASGRRFEVLAEERVFEPLGGEMSAAVAPAHQLWFGWPVRHDRPPRESPASGGWMASADQLARLVDALGSGGRVAGEPRLDPEVVRLATTPGVEIDASSGYAMGWYRRPIAGAPTLSHGGSTPGYSAFALYQEDAERTIVVLTASWGALWGSQAPAWIAADLVRLCSGEAVPERSGAAAKYLWLDLAVLAMLASTVRSAWKLRRRPAQLAALSGPRQRWRAIAPALASHLGVTLAVAWLVPLWARFSLRSFLAVPSDVSLLLFFGIASGLAFAVAEVAALWRAGRRGAHAA